MMQAQQLELDFNAPPPRVPTDARHHRGRAGYHAGLSAEARIARDYEDRGYAVRAQRWRGRGGELDVVARDGDGLVFVEVKHSRDFDRAVRRITPRLIERWTNAALEYLADQGLDLSTPLRFDVALVDAVGRIRVVENALAP